MLFAIMLIDKPDGAILRAETAPTHRVYVGNHAAGMRLGGPLLADDYETMIGSLIIKDFPDQAAAEQFIANEPYNKAGLFETVIIKPFEIKVEHSGN
jgi:uncharacterized protein